MSNDTKKQKILSAARELFVAHGYAGTSMGKIAKLAGVNHSLIFHHFNNKKKLWLDVKMQIVSEFEKVGTMIPSTDLPLEDFLNKAFKNLLSFYESNPDIVRMINWQRLEITAEQYTHSKRFGEWIDAFKTYQKRSEINPALSSQFIATWLISTVSTLGLDSYVFLKSPDEIDAYTQFCITGLLKVLAP